MTGVSAAHTSGGSTVRADLIAAGRVQPHGVALHDGTVAGVGDRIVTRRVDRRLSDGTRSDAPVDERGRLTDGFIKNGAMFTITTVGRDGSIRAHAPGGRPVTLPADYVVEHVELGYAVTAHRCQGVTVDTTHTIATGRMTREAFYVAMTRGRHSNRAYIDTDTCHGATDTLTGEAETQPARTILERILANQGAEDSAHTLQARLTRNLPTPGAQRHAGRAAAYDVGIAR